MFIRNLTFVIELSIIIVNNINDKNALISYLKYTIDFEVRIELENSIENVTISWLKSRVFFDKREENDHIFFTNISNYKFAHSFNFRKLSRTTKAQRCKKRAKQTNLKEKRTQRVKKRRKAITKRKTRTTKTNFVVFDLFVVENCRFLCFICFKDDIKIVKLCDYDFYKKY